ncbi:hypothetical protein J4417_04595 [Candidatus Woesearchaeota archaeon]|nr:hypothetical protein [Candidatus Woesearchaeota archaeon]
MVKRGFYPDGDGPSNLWLVMGIAVVIVIVAVLLYLQNQPSNEELNLSPEAAKSLQAVITPIPDIAANIDLSSVEITFKYFVVPFEINKEGLGLKEPASENTLLIDGYKGKISFSGTSISLKGTASKVYLNGMAYGTEKALNINTVDMPYVNLEIKGTAVSELNFLANNGELTLSDKVIYQLDQDKVELSSFSGDILADTAQQKVELSGQIEEADITGKLISKIK